MRIKNPFRYVITYLLISTFVFSWALDSLASDSKDSTKLNVLTTLEEKQHAKAGRLTKKTIRQAQIDAYLLAVKYPTPPATAKCPQWWKLATDAGWTKDLLPQLDTIIYRESRCNTNSHNPTDPMGGSFGLAQINGYWCKSTQYNPSGWLQAKKILKTCEQLYKPLINLKAAKAIYDYGVDKHGYGWGPWSTKKYL